MPTCKSAHKGKDGLLLLSFPWRELVSWACCKPVKVLPTCLSSCNCCAVFLVIWVQEKWIQPKEKAFRMMKIVEKVCNKPHSAELGSLLSFALQGSLLAVITKAVCVWSIALLSTHRKVNFFFFLISVLWRSFYLHSLPNVNFYLLWSQCELYITKSYMTFAVCLNLFHSLRHRKTGEFKSELSSWFSNTYQFKILR